MGRVWLRGGVGVSDNVRRVPAPTESGNFFSIGVDSDFDYATARLTLSLFADLDWREYSTDDVDDETYGSAILDLEFAALPDRISWIVRDEFSQGRLNPFEVSSPGNRAEANEFQTGPRFMLPLGDRTRLNIEALVGDRRVAETSFLDSDTELASLALVRALSTTTEIALNLVSQGVEYDSPPPTEIDTETAYLSYRKTLASGEAYVALGQTRSERGVDESTTPYINLSWSRDIASRSRLELGLAQQYGDFFDDPAFAAGSEAVLIRDVYEQQIVSVRYLIDGDRNHFTLDLSESSADYNSLAALDYDESRASAEFSRSLTERTGLRVGYWSTERDYSAAARRDDASMWTLALNRQLGRRTALEAIYELHDDEAVLGAPVEENVLTVYLRYALTSAAAEQD